MLHQLTWLDWHDAVGRLAWGSGCRMVCWSTLEEACWAVWTGGIPRQGTTCFAHGQLEDHIYFLACTLNQHAHIQIQTLIKQSAKYRHLPVELSHFSSLQNLASLPHLHWSLLYQCLGAVAAVFLLTNTTKSHAIVVFTLFIKSITNI